MIAGTLRALAVAVLLTPAGGALAQTGLAFPQLTGRVVDAAGLLDPATRASLSQKLETLETKTTDQVVVVTLPGLQGTTIEDFGYRLGRHWQIGQKDKNNGVLLIVAPNERKVRIEVGYGLEGVLTDALTRVIIDAAVLPRFRAGDFSGGIVRGVDAVIDALTNDESEWRARARPAPHEVDWVALLVIGVFVLFVLFMFYHVIRQAARGGGRDFVIRSGSRSSGWSSGSSGSSGSSWSSGSSGGGFSGGGGSFGGGGSSGSW